MKFVKDKNIGMDSKNMFDRYLEAIDTTFEKWKPRKRYEMEVI